MNRSDVWSALVEAIREELDNPRAQVEATMTAHDIPGWDSLAHARIVINVEDRTGALVDMKATYKATTVGELCDIVARLARKA